MWEDYLVNQLGLRSRKYSYELFFLGHPEEAIGTVALAGGSSNMEWSVNLLWFRPLMLNPPPLIPELVGEVLPWLLQDKVLLCWRGPLLILPEFYSMEGLLDLIMGAPLLQRFFWKAGKIKAEFSLSLGELERRKILGHYLEKSSFRRAPIVLQNRSFRPYLEPSMSWGTLSEMKKEKLWRVFVMHLFPRHYVRRFLRGHGFTLKVGAVCFNFGVWKDGWPISQAAPFLHSPNLPHFLAYMLQESMHYFEEEQVYLYLSRKKEHRANVQKYRGFVPELVQQLCLSMRRY